MPHSGYYHYCSWKWWCWNVFNFKNSNLFRGSQFERGMSLFLNFHWYNSAFFTIFSAELCPLEISQDSQDEVHKLRDCISVLFMFVRQPIKDEEFVLILNEWMQQLVCEPFILKRHASSCPNPPIRSVALTVRESWQVCARRVMTFYTSLILGS